MNLATLLDAADPDARALISMGETVTYGALQQQVAAVRGGLAEAGVRPGDRVAIALTSNWYFAVAYWSVIGTGAVAVPVNPQSPTAELQRELADVQPCAVFVGPTAEAAFGAVDRQACGISTVFAPEGVGLPDTRPFEDLLLAAPMPVADRADADLAALLFTSGTAGSPKAAMLSHGNLRSVLEAVQSRPDQALRPDDVILGVLPLFHVFGLNMVLGLAARVGSCVLLVQRFDPVSSLESIRNHRVTVVAGVPPMYEAWAHLPPVDAAGDAFATVRLAASGASKLDPVVAGEFQDRFGLEIGEGYGLTETCAAATAATNPPVRGTIGAPLPGTRIRLVDPADGEPVPAGDTGEIQIQGPGVFLGYWHDDEATRRAMTPDGWLRTGDLAVIDDRGLLSIVDRAKDLIIVSGFNVYPAEVEEVLALHPGIEQAAVVGVPHPHTGESVKAFVVPRPDRLVDEDEVIAFCGRHLARYKCPTKVLVVREIPRSTSGKLIRRDLPL
jgi:long-chain acyl-CoA synthetase